MVPRRRRGFQHYHVLPGPCSLLSALPQLYMTRFIHWEISIMVTTKSFISLAKPRVGNATLLPWETSVQSHHPFLANFNPSGDLSTPVTYIFCSSLRSQVHRRSTSWPVGRFYNSMGVSLMYSELRGCS